MNPDPRRPSSHITVETGWLNDPYGVTWRPEAHSYVLFFQHSPGAPVFDPRMSWAATRSPDLAHWSRPEVVLRPDGQDTGCWSGSAVDTPQGLRLLYTDVGDLEGTDWRLGRVVLADPSTPGSDEVVLPGPPGDVGVTQFRDPFVWAAPGGGWRMVLGAAIGPDEGAVFAYSGPDLRTWRYDGVAARRRMGAPGQDWTGSMWECPQLIEVDGAWVLIISVGQDAPAHVVYSVGQLDWPRFTPGVWRRLWSGDSAYATTAFRDRDGRPCVVSWCRETVPDPASPWSGVLSYAHLLRRSGDRIHSAPHPDVLGLRGGPVLDCPAFAADGAPRQLGVVPAHAELVVRVDLPAGGSLRLGLGQGAEDLMVLTLDADADRVRLGGRGMAVLELPLGAADGEAEVRLLLDASVAEVFTAGGTALVRTAPSGDPLRLTVSAGPAGALVQRLSVRTLRASTGAPAVLS